MAPRGPSKRTINSTAALTTTPPDTLPTSQTICKVLRASGNNLYSVQTPQGKELLAELPSKFRSTIWMRRGGFVVVDVTREEERRNKIEGEIVNVVREEKEWRKMGYWPPEFPKKQVFEEDSDEEESVVGKMPPSDSESEPEKEQDGPK